MSFDYFFHWIRTNEKLIIQNDTDKQGYESVVTMDTETETDNIIANFELVGIYLKKKYIHIRYIYKTRPITKSKNIFWLLSHALKHESI